MTKIRRAFFKSIMRQNINWCDDNQVGELTTKLFDDLERIKEGTGDKVSLAIQYTSQFLGGFIVAFTYDWRLTLIMMSLSPLLIICGAFVTNLVANSTMAEAENYAKAGAIAEECISSIRTVYAFNGQEFEIKRLIL
jgi:ABC-type multidrug transport system fused ATPase/permease subunit